MSTVTAVTVDQLRDGIISAAKFATEFEPSVTDQRARCFVAGLAGWIGTHDPEVEGILWALLENPNATLPPSRAV